MPEDIDHLWGDKQVWLAEHITGTSGRLRQWGGAYDGFARWP